MEQQDTSKRQLTEWEAALCPLVQDLLPLYIEGEVSPDSTRRIEAHLNSCDLCSAFLAGARSVQTQLGREKMGLDQVLRHDHGAQQTMAVGQRFAYRVTIFISIIALIAGTALWASMNQNMRFFGLVVALALVGFLTFLAQRRRVIVFSRWLQMSTAAFAGALGLMRALEANNIDPIFQIFGLLVGFVSLVLVRIALTQDW